MAEHARTAFPFRRSNVTECASDKASFDENENCSFSSVEQTSCRVESSENGQPYRVCERTRQLLRHCMGRPTEVIESTSEQIKDNKLDGSFPEWGSYGKNDRELNDRATGNAKDMFGEGWLKTDVGREGSMFEEPLSRIWESSKNAYRSFLESEDVNGARTRVFSEVDSLIQQAEDFVHDIFGQPERKWVNRGEADRHGQSIPTQKDETERRSVFGQLWPKQKEGGFPSATAPKKDFPYADFSHNYDEV